MRLPAAPGALAAAAILAVGAPAQEIAFSPQATEGCLAAAANTAARVDCIGRSAEACIDTPDGVTTVGMGFCLGAERDWWDARLNVAYAALMQLEEAEDAGMAEIGATAPSTAEALRAMQRAWIAYRDAACLYEHSQWGGGTGGGPAHAACAMRLTGEQALALEERLEVKRRQ